MPSSLITRPKEHVLSNLYMWLARPTSQVDLHEVRAVESKHEARADAREAYVVKKEPRTHVSPRMANSSDVVAKARV